MRYCLGVFFLASRLLGTVPSNAASDLEKPDPGCALNLASSPGLTRTERLDRFVRIATGGARGSRLIDRFPKSATFPTGRSPSLLEDLVEALSGVDFNQTGTAQLRLTRVYSETDFFFVSLPRTQNYERQVELSSELVEGWRKLDLITKKGRFDFSITPALLRKRFEALSGWKTIANYPERLFFSQPIRPKDPKADIARMRLRGFIQKTLFLDDINDFLFLMPMLLSENYQKIAQSIALLSRVDFEKYEARTGTSPTDGSQQLSLFPRLKFYFDPIALEPDEQLETGTFFQFLFQENYVEGAKQYSMGPAVVAPRVVDLDKWRKTLSQLDPDNRPELIKSYLFWDIMRSWPMAGESDWVIRALAGHLYHFSTFIKKSTERDSGQVNVRLGHLHQVQNSLVQLMKKSISQLEVNQLQK